MMTSLEKDIYDRWLEEGDKIRVLSKECVSFPWYVILFKAEYTMKKHKELSQAHAMWTLYFELLITHNVISENDEQINIIKSEWS